jgi:hypothetical protein
VNEKDYRFEFGVSIGGLVYFDWDLEEVIWDGGGDAFFRYFDKYYSHGLSCSLCFQEAMIAIAAILRIQISCLGGVCFSNIHHIFF